MPMSHNGLTKLVEECGELVQIAAKMIAFPSTDEHPDGMGSMRERLENEFADVAAAQSFVAEKLGLDIERMKARAEQKVARFKSWDEPHPDYVTTTSGMRGRFAVYMKWNDENGGFYEPYSTGDTCRPHAVAVADAQAWARADGVEYRP